MTLYTATYSKDGAYTAHDSWMVESSSGSYITQFLENGQTVWYYVKLYDPVADEWSPSSNIQKQTPPITAYIINWPDMLKDLADAIAESDQRMQDFIEDMATPSDDAIDDLKNAIDELKNAVGAGQASGTGTGLVNGLNNAQGGMRPGLTDDGNGTFTGGSTGGQLPSTSQPGGAGGNNGPGGMNLNAPNPDSGTDGEMTFRIPYGVGLDGKLLYVKIFTQEQMEKLKWMGLLRTIFAAIIYIIFGVWLVSRFSPTLKS